MKNIQTAQERTNSTGSNSAVRRRQFVNAATDLFSNKGFHETTVKEIAEKAGASPGLVYNYVRDKEELLLLAIMGVLESYKKEVPKAVNGQSDPIIRFSAALTAYIEVVANKPKATLLAYRYTAILPPSMRDQIKQLEIETNRIISECISDCIAAGYFREINVELISYRAVLLAHGWALKSWRLGKLHSVEEYIEGNLDLFLTALFTDKGREHYRDLGFVKSK
ncbi:TetR/AcrR family transcriptional regulator [uncultured Sneathiella sp.]|jgi:AcrR family transcriptional regulator|uniref:TetR/AcrR family transcriptional regulator n=1 Tax=uncultured Sneathiella sp. TaxID=879315 RepID=UPI0030DB2962|tara:strand:+ start:386 stop:1054 length:669 start_codon:yes stop_codon:yes gene_type:complete